jgi:MFS family permease
MSAEQKPAQAPSPKRFSTFLVIWLGQTISRIGSGMTTFAISVWLFQETGNATPIAVTALSQWIPRIVLAPLAGMVADRYSRKAVMILADTLAAVATATAAVLVLSGQLEVWHIFVVAGVTGIAGSFQSPAFTASIAMIVKKEDFSRAAGLTQVTQALESVASPVMAGMLIAPIGLAGVIFVDLATFSAAVVALLVSRVPMPARSRTTVAEEGSGGLKRALYGLRYIADRGGLMGMLIYFALVNFAGNMAAILISPMVLSFANAANLGVVQTAGGMGMLLGSLAVSIWGGPKQRMAGVYAAVAVAGVGLIIMGLGARTIIPAAGMFIMLSLIPIANGAAAAIWQSKVAPDVQGRVFAARGMIATITMPLAFGISGPLADRVFQPLMHGASGPQTVLAADAPALLSAIVGNGPGRGYAVMLVISGVMLLAGTVVFLLYRPLRRVETDLPDLVDADEEATPSAEAEPSPAPAADPAEEPVPVADPAEAPAAAR